MNCISPFLLAIVIAFQPQTPIRITLTQRTMEEEGTHVTAFSVYNSYRLNDRVELWMISALGHIAPSRQEA